MPLDLDCTDPMYLLGRFVASLEGAYPSPRARRVSDGPTLDIMLVRPRLGLQKLLQQAWIRERMRDPDLASIMDLLPADGLPKGPVPVEDQAPYWTGYYHQRGQDQRDYAMTTRFSGDILRQVGETLYGPDHWQAEMTRALGLTDSSRVRSWISDNPGKRRKVPAGVCRDLLAMLRQRSAEAKALAEAIESGEIEAPPDDGPHGDDPEP